MVIIYEQIEKGQDYEINCFLIEGERLKKRAPAPFNLGVACKGKGIDINKIKTLSEVIVEKEKDGETITNHPISKEKIQEFVGGYEIPEEKLGNLLRYYKD